MTSIDRTKPVMVTGATGYVAGRLVEKLLNEGVTVHAAVRNPDDKEKLKYLDAIAAKSKGTIKYFKADLLTPGSYNQAMKGCELVYHTASPFTVSVKDPQKDLVDPALKGTRNVLESVNDTTEVKRVVLTSSCVSIFGDTKDILSYPGKIATENNWNTSSSLKHQPYGYSKVLAEKEAWKINRSQNRWDMVVINPSLVIGPGINPNGTSESFSIIKMLGDGSLKSGAPGFDFGLVDVRDVALAHYNAGFIPEANGRNIIAADHRTMLQLAETLSNKFGNKYKFPNKSVPKFMVWLMAPTVGMKRKFISRNIPYPWVFDNSKSIQELGINYRSVDDSVVEFFQQIVDSGSIK
jgi:dihydroflavonol-4-reductase